MEKQLSESNKAGKEATEQHRQQHAELQKRLDEAEKNASAELKARQAALDMALKSHNEQLAAAKAKK
ncbi:hypothetical protein [Yersinia enterocolitica]